MLRLRLLGLLVAVCLAPSTIAATFTPLGDLPGDGFYSDARAVSSDGAVVVGQSDSTLGESAEAYRWSAAAGMVPLGDLPGGPFASVAYGTSADGSVVVGTAHIGTQRAFRWTESDGLVSLGILQGLPGTVSSHASAVSADGSVVVGNSGPTDIANSGRAYRWTQALGMIDLGLPINGRQASASDVSADGTVVVGVTESTSDVPQAFRWTEATGFVGLGDLPGADFVSAATGVSGDGLVVVGHSNATAGGEAFRWTLATGMVSIGDVPGGMVNTTPWATNFDGSVIVGQGSAGSGAPSGDAAFIWDSVNGLRNLQTVLVGDFGLNLTGWILTTAQDISANGRVIVGTGIDPTGNVQAWRVELPIPEPSAAVLCAVALVSVLGAARRQE